MSIRAYPTFLAAVLTLAMIGGDLARAATPNLQTNIDRPLRYRPEAGGFVIENGPDSFNRPLYGGNTAFRVDAGDKPEFSLYVPGRGGNLRIGIKTAGGAKWLQDMEKITTRYRAGAMRYEIRDALLGSGIIRVEALGLDTTEGLIVRVDVEGIGEGSELLIAFGGANGDRGSRSGDIGTEREPVSRFFALRPEYCKDNKFEISGSNFVLLSKPAPGKIAGIMPAGISMVLADAAKWGSPGELLAGAAEAASPVVAGHVKIENGKSLYLALQRLAEAATTQPVALEAPRVSALQDLPTTQSALLGSAVSVGDLPTLFDKTREHFERLSKQVTVDTPDEFINSAVPALNLAADAVWDDAGQAFMHGAVAWRTKLLGWRGPYAGDALGSHERTRAHLENWFTKQNVKPVDPNFNPGADKDSELTRSEAMLHTNGDLTQSHYDMNLVAIDALLRHLLWTGDKEYARKVWPMLERHLAWERRLFRREYGEEKLPLYEGYAAIWASDDLQYNGGGATHSSAYNYYHNLMAARIATWIGNDPSDYQKEAELIRQGMQQYLWLAEKGWFAEFRDLLGAQLAHPSAAVWTNYHTTDSLAADQFQSWQMGRYIDTQIPHIPLRGPGVPAGFSQISTTSWMPYTWSINNVVMAETMHTALSRFQSDQDPAGFALLKGAILDSMFMGQCPGNVGMATYYDDYRRESQRDFADAVGITSRTVVEGLFGIKPDAIAGTLAIRPGFPADWEHASINHPDVSLQFKREQLFDSYSVQWKRPSPMKIALQIAAPRTEIAGVTVNGARAAYRVLEDSIGTPRIQIDAPSGNSWNVVIRWQGAAPPTGAKYPSIAVVGRPFRADVERAELLRLFDPQQVLDAASMRSSYVSGTIAGAPAHRTLFAKARSGMLTWWVLIEFETRASGLEVVDVEDQDDQHLRFRVRTNLLDAIERDVVIRSGATTIRTRLVQAEPGLSQSVDIPAEGLLPGSNRISIESGAEKFEGVVTNWKINLAKDAKPLESVDLKGAFNDRVTQIFKNAHLSPRSPFCSLSLAIDGVGMWTTFSVKPEIDDTGLRAAAARDAGKFSLPQGVQFATPGTGDAKNIAFASQWDNYPREVVVPLGGKASRAYFMLAGSTNAMQSRFENARIIVTYGDGSTDELPLVNPTNYWPIEKDYFVDDFAFARPQPVPPRVELRTGSVRIADPSQIKGQREAIPGGAGFVLDLPLDGQKELRSITLRAVANDVVIGLMGVTLAR